jgi:hypothetical protein
LALGAAWSTASGYGAAMWWLLLACAPRVPSASIARVHLSGVDFDELRGEVVVAVDNPSYATVPVNGARWELLLDGRTVGSGALTDAVSVGPDAITDLAVPVVVRWSELGAVMASMTTYSVPYTLRASLELDLPTGPHTLPVERSGLVPRLSPPRFDGAWLGFDGTAWALDGRAWVPVPPGVSLDGLRWLASLDDTEVGSGWATVAADGAARVHAELHPVSAAMAAGAAWWAGTGTVELAVDGTLHTPLGAVPLTGSTRARW